MNLALSEEQFLLREAARGALARVETLGTARAALDGAAELPDLWPLAAEAGWAGLLIGEEHGGAALEAFDAMLLMGECGRVLASVPLLGHLLASAILDEAPVASGFMPALAAGERRVAYLPARPPDELEGSWSADPGRGLARGELPRAGAPEADGRVSLEGDFWFVPDAPGADAFVGVALREGAPVGVAVLSDSPGVKVTPITRYDPTRSLGHVSLRGAPAVLLDAPARELSRAWHLAQSLIAAESLGSVETALERSVAYALERHTFGRAIGSYQAVKHPLTEVLRLLENGRSLLFYAGWSYASAPDEFALAASAARSVAGHALDVSSRTMISVHGGIGATWEHDAPLYFRRAQLSRLLLGGTANATDRVADELLARAPSAASERGAQPR